MVETVGLVVKTCIVPTSEVLTRALNESKTDVHAKLPKIEVLIGGILVEVCTIKELTRMCTPKIDKTKESKIVELETTLTIDGPDSGTEEVEGYSSVDEVVDTSIRDTWS